MTHSKLTKITLSCATALGMVALAGSANIANAADISACLITKTDTNPFFVKMREGASSKAKELGIDLKSYAGKIDGDNQTQVQAVETCIAEGAKGILITASDTAAIVPVVEEARKAGILVIALDTPLQPITAADATFATDNFLAGELIGKWAAGTLGDGAATAKIAMLDLAVSQPSVGVMRDQGFLQGFGIDIGNPKLWGDETDPRIIGHDVTAGNEEGGQRAMESMLAKDSNVNLVYTINEPAAAGAYQALKSVGKEKDVTIVSVDGGCPGIQNVADGVIGATSQQYPLLMASMGIEAIAKFAADGTKPMPTKGKSFFDTGVSLVTKHPVDGVKSISVEEGKKLCWG